MKRWTIAILAFLAIGCRNETKDKAPDTLQQDELPEGIRKLYRLSAENPDSVGLRMQLVDSLDNFGAYKKALEQMDALITKDSLNYAFWYRKALVQQNLHDTGGALRSYRYAIRIYPSPDAMLGAANLLAEKKDSTALVIAKQIADLHLGREYMAHSHFIAGVYYARTGNQSKAIDEFNACIYNDYTYLEAYMEKGFLFYDNKKIKEAQQVFQTVVNIRNTYPDGYYWLAKCQEALNDKAGAIANYQRALQLDASIKEAAEGLKRLQ